MADFKSGLKKIKVSKPRDGFDDCCVEPNFPSFPPNFHVTDKQIPEVKDWEAGKNYFLVIEVRQVSKIDRVDEPVRGEFDIVRYKALTGKKLDDMTDEEFGEFQGSELSKINKQNKSS